MQYYYKVIVVQADPDNDGLSNEREAALGTNPNDPDTDNDGLPDGDEVDKYGTSPVDHDTDSDGLSDGDEVNKYGTDPKDKDTDDDGLDDGTEVMSYGTDPKSPDTDGDGLSDKEETEVYLTNPKSKDTDNDGLSDSKEIGLGTSPTKVDTDGDNLPDSNEVSLGSDPLNPDTDSDGVIDGLDVDPLGDVILVVTVDYWEELESADTLTWGDPIFVVEVYSGQEFIGRVTDGPYSNVAIVRGATLVLNIPDDKRIFSLLIYVVDEDPGGYTVYDISPVLGETSVMLDYHVGDTLTITLDGSVDGSRLDVDGLLQITITTESR